MIKDYINENEFHNWDKFNVQLIPGFDPNKTIIYLNKKYAVQFIATEENDNMLITIAFLKSLNKNVDDVDSYLLENSPKLLKNVIKNNITLKRQPNDPRRPDLNFYRAFKT